MEKAMFSRFRQMWHQLGRRRGGGFRQAWSTRTAAACGPDLRARLDLPRFPSTARDPWHAIRAPAPSQQRQPPRRHRARIVGSLVPVDERTDVEQLTCVACQDFQIQTCCLPCGHCCYCRSCALEAVDRSWKDGTALYCPRCGGDVECLQALRFDRAA